MNFKNNDYEKWISYFGNSYSAVIGVSELAKEKIKVTSEYLSESDALEWVITGKKPKSTMIKSNKFEKSYMYNLLAEVSDKNIVTSVVKSVYASKDKPTLEFIYIGDLDEFQKSRVRILCRMIRYQNS